jgi:hypothetical protein
MLHRPQAVRLVGVREMLHRVEPLLLHLRLHILLSRGHGLLHGPRQLPYSLSVLTYLLT